MTIEIWSPIGKKTQILNEYAGYRKEIMDMLFEFQIMWQVHLEKINTAKYFIKLTTKYTQPSHSAPYWMASKFQEMEKAEGDKMLLQKFIESAETKWAVSIVFA